MPYDLVKSAPKIPNLSFNRLVSKKLFPNDTETFSSISMCSPYQFPVYIYHCNSCAMHIQNTSGVYFDQQTGALHTVCGLEHPYYFGKLTSFLVFFSVTIRKKGEKAQKI